MTDKVITAVLLGWMAGFLAFVFLPGGWHYSAPIWSFGATLAFLRINGT